MCAPGGVKCFGEGWLIMLPHRAQVLARSSPEDKLTLVSMLKKEGEVVAVTGG